MKRSQINPMPQYYDYYINLVADVQLSEACDRSIRQLNELDKDLLTRLDGQRYAPDSLLFARGVGSNPQDIDQHVLARNSLAKARTIDSLIEELKVLRLATRALYESLDDHALLNTGISSKYETSVLAMGFMMMGHQIHHLKVIEEEYFPLLQTTPAKSSSTSQ